MSVTINSVTTTQTFSNWVDTTNDLVDFADIAMTLNGDNTGNTSLSGNFSVGTNDIISANNLSAVSGGKITIAGQLETSDTISINKADTAGTLQFKLGGSDTWSLETSSNHDSLVLTDGTHHLTIADDGDITSTGRISNGMMPVNISLDGSLTATNLATLPSVDIAGGNIKGLTTLGTANHPIATSVFTTVDINGGGIDSTTIGASTPMPGTFTAITGTSLSVTGDTTFTGDLTVTGTLTATSSVAASLNETGIAAVLLRVYPVGAVYISTVNTSPATLFGGGWTSIGGGRVLQTVSGSTPAAGQNYSGNSRSISVANMPAHTHVHTVKTGRSFSSSLGDAPIVQGSNQTIRDTADETTSSTGGGTAFNVQQASHGVYMWKRTS
jgi:hypothetical protein